MGDRWTVAGHPGVRPTLSKAADRRMKVAFDSRPGKDERGIGRYVRCLLEALRENGDVEVVESHTPRRCDLFHSPWIEGAQLRCPVPMVVTLHDLVALKRQGEYLRTGVRFKLRYLAVQRGARVIVPTRGGRRRRDAHAPDPGRADRRDPRGSGTRLLAAVRGRGERGPRAFRSPRALPRMGGRAAPARPAQACRGIDARAADDATGARRTGRTLGERARRRSADRRGRRRRPGRDLHRRPCARLPERRRGLRAAAGRGARVRHAGRRMRSPGAARGPQRLASSSPRSATSTDSCATPSRCAGRRRRRPPGPGATRPERPASHTPMRSRPSRRGATTPRGGGGCATRGRERCDAPTCPASCSPRYRLSSSSVTGPSLTSSTSMWAPNTPRLASSSSQKRSYSGSR